MNEPSQQSLEERSRALFENSVDNVDMRVRSRLTQARHAALDAASSRRTRIAVSWWTPAAGLTAAAVLGVALWMGSTSAQHPVSLADAQSIEDLDLLASSEGPGDTIDMLQDDIDFYDFADKAAESEPAA
jgi:hypothetical protein